MPVHSGWATCHAQPVAPEVPTGTGRAAKTSKVPTPFTTRHVCPPSLPQALPGHLGQAPAGHIRRGADADPGRFADRHLVAATDPAVNRNHGRPGRSHRAPDRRRLPLPGHQLRTLQGHRPELGARGGRHPGGPILPPPSSFTTHALPSWANACSWPKTAPCWTASMPQEKTF